MVDRVFIISNGIFLTIILVLMIYPFWNVVMTSFSDVNEISRHGGVNLLPRGFSTVGYRRLFQEKMLFRYYANTILYAGIGTMLCLLVSALTGYALSVPTFSLRRPIMILMVITMYVSGGLIPYYLWINQLGMLDTLWVMVIPGALNVYNCIVFKTFFQQIPSDMKEAAYLDGANDVQLLWYIVLPVSKALLATFAIFSVVSYWNGWFDAMIFLRDTSKYPIQNYLRNLLINMASLAADPTTAQATQARTDTDTVKLVRSAVIVVTTLPIMVIYPFFQKHFAKGVIVGSLKG